MADDRKCLECGEPSGSHTYCHKCADAIWKGGDKHPMRYCVECDERESRRYIRVCPKCDCGKSHRVCPTCGRVGGENCRKCKNPTVSVCIKCETPTVSRFIDKCSCGGALVDVKR